MKYTQGGFTYQDLRLMPIGEYNSLKYCINILVSEEEKEIEEQKKDAQDTADEMKGIVSKVKGIGMKK